MHLFLCDSRLPPLLVCTIVRVSEYIRQALLTHAQHCWLATSSKHASTDGPTSTHYGMPTCNRQSHIYMHIGLPIRHGCHVCAQPSSFSLKPCFYVCQAIADQIDCLRTCTSLPALTRHPTAAMLQSIDNLSTLLLIAFRSKCVCSSILRKTT